MAQEIPITVAVGETESGMIDLFDYISSEFDDYVLCGVLTPAGLDAVTMTLLYGTEEGQSLPYEDSDGDPISIVVAASKAIRLKVSDFPFLPRYFGVVLGTEVAGAASELTFLVRRA